ncbi:hypothetical protein ES705_25586 [subsurface metagenome]
MSTVTEGKCPPHRFMINSENVGYCSCGEVRDFGKLLIREGHGLGKRQRREERKAREAGKKGGIKHEKRITF